MPYPFVALANRLSHWVRRRGTGRGGPSRRAVVSREWVSVGVSGPVPLLVMYRDILGQHGIQAVLTDTGVGPGALGGVPGFGMLRVAASDLDLARTVLQADAVENETDVVSTIPYERDQSDQSERINSRGE